jgi:hypothetical protein
MPDQAQFGTEYFLAYMLPNFNSKISTQLLDLQKDNGPFPFSLLGQCFQVVGLTEWTSVVAKGCPDDADRTKANFDECIRDYLEAVAGFPNNGNQLICLVRMAKNPADYLRRTMDVPTALEKSEQIFFVQPKVHQNKFANLNKTVPANPLRMIAFFEQCQATNKAAGVLKKIAIDKKQPKEKRVAHVPTARSHEWSYMQHHCHKYCDYHRSDQYDCKDCQPDDHHQDDQRYDCGRRNDKDARNNKSYNKKDDCKRDHFKKKSDKIMHNDQSSLSSAGNFSRKSVGLRSPTLTTHGVRGKEKSEG